MLLLQIRSIEEFKPIKWEGKNMFDLKPGEEFFRFPGEHPNNPESGHVVMSVDKISGEFDRVDQVLLIEDQLYKGRINTHQNIEDEGYKVELKFDIIFGCGLEYSLDGALKIGSVLLGLTRTEKRSLSSLKTKQSLLSALADLIIPDKKELILGFAKPGYLCIPNKKSNSEKSHYVGAPKHSVSEILDNNSHPLFHLATLNLSEFSQKPIEIKEIPNLSFYLKIQDTVNGWPESKGDFRVLQDHDKKSIHPVGGFDTPVNFKIKPILDLPDYDHSIIKYHKFTEEDSSRYDSLRSLFRELTMEQYIDEEVNKFLGYPDNVQNCVAYEAERIFNSRVHSDEISQDAIDWQLLFQVSPMCREFNFFEEFGFGTIYYMIKEEDLKSGDFSKCQLVVQST